MKTSLRRFLLALVGFVAWTVTGYLLSGRLHLVFRYQVAHGYQCLDWKLLMLVLIGLALAFGAWQAAGPRREAGSGGSASAAWWLIACAALPILEEVRQMGLALPRTFGEPLFFAFASGMSAWGSAKRCPSLSDAGASLRSAITQPCAAAPRPRRRQPAAEFPWFWCAAAAALACGAWWYRQSVVAYSNYLLGYHDFADFARRVANTWEGRGLLVRSPIWPAFFDHVNPGLLALVPLWGLWPDVRLFFVLQAICLALPALLAYAIARRLGATSRGAAFWAGAYLVFPAVGQLNLCFSYGFHAVSMALPLLFAAAWSCLSRRRWLALVLAIAACTFKENVFVIASGLALAFAVLETIQRRGGRSAEPDTGTTDEKSRVPFSSLTGLTPRAWLAVSGAFAGAFLLVSYSCGLTGGAGTWRFAHLGRTFGEVLLSPVLRPRAFWGEVFKARSGYYLLSLVVPAGLPSVLRGWPLLTALVVPVALLLAWNFDGATCIAMQYVTLLIPVIFLAAMIGAARRAGKQKVGLNDALTSAGLLALTSGTVASVFIGALPFSRTTIPFTLSSEEAAARAPYRRALDRAVAMTGGPEAATLASGRLAAHLLGVRRLEMVRHALEKLDALNREAGPGKSWVEVFDYVAVDLADRAFHHSLAELETCVLAAESAGYRPVFADGGVLVYRRPGNAGQPLPDALAPWRVPAEEARKLAGREEVRVLAPGLQIAGMRTRMVHSTEPGRRQIAVELVLQASQDQPAEYYVRHVVRSNDGQIVADTGFRAPVGGNRPTSWWKKGETWVERYTISIPGNVSPEGISHQFMAAPYEHPLDRSR